MVNDFSPSRSVSYRNFCNFTREFLGILTCKKRRIPLQEQLVDLQENGKTPD